MRKQRGFTLIELLTVIAITAVLMTLIILPIAQSFNLVRAAQGFAAAQDKARTLVERVAREISNSAGIRDNNRLEAGMLVRVPNETGLPVDLVLRYTKLDIIKPAEGDPALRDVSGAFINPNTGRADPTLRAPKGQMVLPVTPGNTITRYFIGRRDPSQPYNNPYDGLLMARNGTQDNLYVLYKAEVQPYIWVGGAYRVNNELFFDQDRDSDPSTHGPQMDDPAFFENSPPVALPAYAQGPFPGQPADPNRSQMVQNWQDRAVVVTEFSRYDMIQSVFDKAKRKVVYDNTIPRLIPLIQFRPTGIGNEPVGGQVAVRLSEETDNSTAVAPDVFRTKFGSWSSLFVRLWYNGFDPASPTSYLVGRTDAATKQFTVVSFDPAVNTNEQTDGTNLFSSDGYLESVRRNDLYPFTANLFATNLVGPARDLFIPFAADMRAGRITTSFPIEEVGLDVRPDRTPTGNCGQPFSPQNDPNLGSPLATPIFTPSDPAYLINSSFNKVWAEQSVPSGPNNYGLVPDVHRFLDLRVMRFSDGAYSPLHPDPALGFSRTRIVPGSDVVMGPDQVPGPNYGQPVRYSRVTRNPGPNQYRINYVDLPEPRNPATNAIDYSVFAPGMPNPPALYTSADFVSAFIQPRFKAGYVQFNSDPNVPLPQGNITVSYRFQMNGANDTLSVDYDSRQLMSILLTIKNYPQTSIPNPQSITLSATATTRNVVR